MTDKGDLKKKCRVFPVKFVISFQFSRLVKCGEKFIPLGKKLYPMNEKGIRCFDGFGKTYSESCQTSEMEFFAEIVNGFKSLTIFAKSSFLDV